MMNTFNKIEHLKALEAQKKALEREIEEIKTELKEIAGTKEKPTVCGMFNIWLTESETTSYNKEIVLAKCPEAIKHGVKITLYIK